MNLSELVGAKGAASSHKEKDAAPERNFAEERLRHAGRLIKAVHGHDIEGADDAMRVHHAVCADEDEATKG